MPLRKEAARLRDALSEAKLKAATLAERQTYTSRVVDARTRDLDAVAASDADAREALVKKRVAQERIEPLLALFAIVTLVVCMLAAWEWGQLSGFTTRSIVLESAGSGFLDCSGY